MAHRALVVLGLLLGVVVHGREFEDKLLPQAVRDRRACFTKALRKTLAYDLNQNYVRNIETLPSFPELGHASGTFEGCISCEEVACKEVTLVRLFCPSRVYVAFSNPHTKPLLLSLTVSSCFFPSHQLPGFYFCGRLQFMMGCDTEALWGFETWADNTGCGKEELDGPL